MSQDKWKLFVCFSLLIILLILKGCSKHEVDTWPEWCEQIAGVNLEKKYNKGFIFSVSFNKEAIRKDFIEQYNLLVLSNVGSKYMGGAEPNSNVMKELSRLQMVGVWSEGDKLHIANVLLFKDKRLGLDEFPEFVKNYKFYLNLNDNRNKLDDYQYCLFGTINSLFESVVLHGPEKSDQVEIKVEHSLR